MYLQFSLQYWIFCGTVSSQRGLVFVHYFDIHCRLQSGNWTHTRANSFSPGFCCISILCSGAAFLNKQALMLQPLFSSVAMTARISARDGESHGSGNEFIMTKVVCKKHTSGVFTPKAADVCVSSCLFLHTVAFPVWAHVFVRMFVLLKGLAQSRPFVVGSSGLPIQLVWFMDESELH